MKIAATYDNGNIFPHFGRTEQFKIYDVEDGKVVSSKVIGTDGRGHEALAEVLTENTIDVLICGGMGQGAMNAMEAAGVKVFAGAEGSADEAVEAFLKGELASTGVNCDHHGHEHGEEGCGHGSCADSSGCGGCHSALPPIEGKNVGKKVRVHYQGSLDDGTIFDSSYDRGEPIEFTCGAGEMIRGFDAVVALMDPQQREYVHIRPDQAYGPYDPNAKFTIEMSKMPGTEDLQVGEWICLYDRMGNPVEAKVEAKTETEITFDLNHEMAGKNLNFMIELVEVVE